MDALSKIDFYIERCGRSPLEAAAIVQAAQLKRIADALEKQNAGTDEEFRQRVIAAIHQGIPMTITGGYINCDEKLTYIKPDGIAIDNEKITSDRLLGAK